MSKEFKILQKMSFEMANLAGEFAFQLSQIIRRDGQYAVISSDYRAQLESKYYLHVARASGLSLGYAFRAAEILYDRKQ